MASRKPFVSGTERFFSDDEIIVSKTDPKGRVTYANEVFLHIAGYTEREVIGAPHSLIRHPDMPRAAFKLLWDVLATGSEIFAYVKNRSKNGDHYWVLAHVTPTYDSQTGALTGYHSNRRPPNRKALTVIEPLYARILDIEAKSADAKAGLAASFAALTGAVAETGMPYDELVFHLEGL